MEIINFRSGEKSIKDVYVGIRPGVSKRWTIQSQKSKFINNKFSEVIEVDYSASLDNPNYDLGVDKGNNTIQITAHKGISGSGLCVLTQNESGNKINIHITTPEERE